MTNYTYIVGLLILIVNSSYCQHEADNWYFGNGAGINFSSGQVTVLNDGQMDNHWEGIVSISDPHTGNLQFYSNGIKVWNSDHNIMPNGSGLAGDNSSSMILAVPFINDPTKYYLFTTTSNGGDIRYSVIDMNLDNGMGDIVSDSKNTLFRSNCDEKITACKSPNNEGYWVLVHEKNSNNFYSYLIDSIGINQPVHSSIGTISNSSIGYMKFSHNGNRLGFAHYDGSPSGPMPFELYDFDNMTGTISSFQVLFESENLYGLEFSPNDSKLYASFDGGYTVQFDLNAGTLQDIQNSQTTLFYNQGSIQLAPNGRIYIANSGNYYLDEITYPNNPGLSCSPIENSIYLGNGECRLGLPNFVQSIFDATTYIKESELEKINFNVFPVPSKDLINLKSDIEIEGIRIWSVNGQTIWTLNNCTSKTYQIDLYPFEKGIYFIEIKTKFGILTKRMVKI